MAQSKHCKPRPGTVQNTLITPSSTNHQKSKMLLSNQRRPAREGLFWPYYTGFSVGAVSQGVKPRSPTHHSRRKCKSAVGIRSQRQMLAMLPATVVVAYDSNHSSLVNSTKKKKFELTHCTHLSWARVGSSSLIFCPSAGGFEKQKAQITHPSRACRHPR